MTAWGGGNGGGHGGEGRQAYIGAGGGGGAGGAGGFAYVVGTPPRAPVLRPIQQPMYFRVVIMPGDTSALAFWETVGRARPDGRPMTYADTNMACAGMLGTPLEYDLARVGIHPAEFGTAYKDRWNQFLSERITFRWVMGGDTTFVRVPLAMMEPRLPSPYNDRARYPDLPEILHRLNAETAVPRFVNMTRPDHRPLRIVSTETFRAEFRMDERAWPYPQFEFYVAMHGMLYTQL